MMFTVLIAIFATVGALPSGLGVPSDLASLLEGPITWIGNVERGGPNLPFTGHHTDIMAKIKSHSPYWLREGLAERSFADLEKRDPVSSQLCPSNFDCMPYP